LGDWAGQDFEDILAEHIGWDDGDKKGNEGINYPFSEVVEMFEEGHTVRRLFSLPHHLLYPLFPLYPSLYLHGYL